MEEKEAKEELEKGYEKAEELLKDQDKLERVLRRLENKLKNIPVAGKKLAMVPMMISLVKSYVKKEYTDIPIGTIVAVISALVYVLSVVDVIPDTIPGIGYLDDVAVVGFCLKMVQSDLDEYEVWRKEHDKKIGAYEEDHPTI